jgi:hypothetical protein
VSCTEITWLDIEDMRHEHRLATDRDYHLQQEERMSKTPAAEELITITFKLRELEAVLRALHSKQNELEHNGERSERALSVVLDAIDKTAAAIDTAVYMRKRGDVPLPPKEKHHVPAPVELYRRR